MDQDAYTTQFDAEISILTRKAEAACRRCGGLMVVDDCLDILGGLGEFDCQVLRCVQCGDLVDPVILRNRTSPPALTPKKRLKWSSVKRAAAGYR